MNTYVEYDALYRYVTLLFRVCLRVLLCAELLLQLVGAEVSI